MCLTNFCTEFTAPGTEWCPTCSNNGANSRRSLCSINPQYKNNYCENCFWSCRDCDTTLSRDKNLHYCGHCGKKKDADQL